MTSSGTVRASTKLSVQSPTAAQDYGPHHESWFSSLGESEARSIRYAQDLAPASLLAQDHIQEARPRLIQISDDIHLSMSRQPLLIRVGFAVYSFSSYDAGAAMRTSEPFFDVALLCQTINEVAATAYSHLLRERNSNVHIVRLTRNAAHTMGIYDLVLPSPVFPDTLTREMIRVREFGCMQKVSRH